MRFIFLFLFFFSISYAHKINLFITEESNKLSIYSYFANGKACKNCRLVIKVNKQIVLADVLDSNGEYLYTPQHNKIEVLIDAGAGHIATQSVAVENVQTVDIKEHKKVEEKKEYRKVLIGLFSIFLIFFLLKRFKK